ncbi:hypothetical protein Sste5346_006158 [Sporothrix stenoceras]|uniref:Uncharacterized protein n=1 Tax=Sporothrix stenoceras TaxID=5173 RepID=A0ABR3Z0A0_9PEZI
MPAEPSFAFDKRGRRQSHVAVMSRAVSFTTFGITNEIEAVRRNPFGDNDYLVAFNLVLVGLQGEKFSGLATLLPASSTPQASLSALSMPAFLFIK